MQLCTVDMWNCFGEQSQLQAWGLNGIAVSQYFETSVNVLDRHLFEISTDDSAIGSSTQYFKAFPPKSSYEFHLLSVFKLTTKDPTLKKKPLDVHGYPKAVTWKPDVYFLADESPVPEPSTWPHLQVQPSNVTDIFAMGDMVVEQPSKRARK